MNKAYLILSDGSVYEGCSFGAAPKSTKELGASSNEGFGEVVFNTSMTGYHEIITDPSYTGQLIVMTYPLIGNYGCHDSWSETGPEQGEKRTIKARGLVVRELYEGPVPEGRVSLASYLKQHGIPGITDIDTRALTLSLRDSGSRNGIIIKSEQDLLTDKEKEQALKWLSSRPEMEGQNLIGEVGTTGTMEIHKKGSFHMGLIDYGIKNSIIDQLVARDIRVTLFPSEVSAKQIKASGIQALFLSNGPGDPAVLHKQIKTIRSFIGTLPIYGICLGHQLIALALGAKTYKMDFGHHGGNHPVRDEESGKVFVTSQNHGFAVEESSLPEDVAIWFRNANDGSVEGLSHTKLPIRCVQFHPEAAPGPQEGSWFFDVITEEARGLSEPNPPSKEREE